MSQPILTLLELSASMADLDMIQSWVDQARIAAPTNQVVQAKLDQQQIEIDTKRAQINLMMLDISSRN